MIVFDCPACGKHFSFSDRFAGRQMICSGCKTEIVVPEAEEELGLAPMPDDDLSPVGESYAIKEPVVPVVPLVSPAAPLPPPLPESATFPFSSPETPVSPAPPIPPPPPPLPFASETAGPPLPGLPPSWEGQTDAFSPPSEIPTPFGFPPPPPFSDLASSPTSTDESGILAYVYEEKHRNAQEMPVPVVPPVPEPKVPETASPLRKNLMFWGGIASMLLLVLGLCLYLALGVDWRPADTRPLLIERLEQQKSQATIQAKNKLGESETLRLRSLENWNATGEVIDAWVVAIGEFDEKRLDLLDMEKILRTNDSNEALKRQLTPKRDEIAASLKVVEERLERLQTRISEGAQKASGDETAADLARRESMLHEKEAAFYEKQAETLRKRMRDFPDERSSVYSEAFDADRNRVSVDGTVRLDLDWTEDYFDHFVFPDFTPGRFAAAFDGVRRLHGSKSLRITSLEKTPAALLQFPKDRNARTSLDGARFMVFSLRFPELREPIMIGSDPATGKFGELRVRLGNSAGYIEYRTISPRYCEALFYDARGKFLPVEFSLEGDTFWSRSDHFDMSKFDQSDDSLDAMLARRNESTDGDEAAGEAEERSFFARIDWVEFRLAPLSGRTTFWIDGISISEKRSREPYNLLQAETLQQELRKQEKTFLEQRRSAPRLSAILSATQGNPDAPQSGSDVEFIDPENEDGEKPAANTEGKTAPKGAATPKSNDSLEFEGTDEERTRKLFRWVLQNAKGRIRATIDGQVHTLGPKSRIPDALGNVRIEDIDLAGFQDLSMERVAEIGAIRELKRLNLSRTALKNSAIDKLSALASLESLNLAGNDLTFEALPALRPMKNLKELNIDGMKTSARGIDALASLTSLRTLVMSRSGLDGSDLNYLLPLADLETLDLSSTKIGDRGLAVLRVFTDLQSLNLSRTRITSTGLDSLDALRNLRKLQLDGTALDDGALDAIGKISSLETVSASKTSITVEGVRRKLGAGWLAKFKLSSNESEDAP